MRRIQRHIRPTRSNHRIHPHNQIQRAGHQQPHQRLRTHTPRDQIPRQPVHPTSELPIRQLSALERHRHPIRIHSHRTLEPIQQQPLRHHMPRRIPRRQHLGTLHRSQHLHIPHRHRRIRNNRTQQPDEPIHKPLRGSMIEQSRGIGQDTCHTGGFADGVVRIAEQDIEVELGDPGIDVQAGHRETW